jgi:hypothetical protein
VAGATTAATCGYGTGGQEAGTLCWLDMTNYDAATSNSAAG